MKNLKLYSESTLNLELQSKQEVLLFSALDIDRNRLFFASSANFIYSTQLSSFHNGISWRKQSLPAGVHPIDLEEGDFITSFDYLMEKEALIVGTCNGVMLLYNVDDNSVEIVGQVEGGVKCIAPSPDGELLGIVTGLGQMLVMTYDWDLLYENALEDDHPDGVDVSGPTFPYTNMSKSTVSWRGDGKYFVTLFEAGDNSSLNKRLKVWERDSGTLHAASDSKGFMGVALDWMPSGAKIAAVYNRRMENECPKIVFYERNGLYRSSFSINESVDTTVELLRWNCTSDILASVVRCDKYDSVKVWFFSNNHWYLKQEIRYPRQDGVRFMWDPVKPLELICWTLQGQITVYNFIWITSVTDNSIAFVIDGSKILVTPLFLSLIPPPLQLFNLKFPSVVRDMAFYYKNSKNLLAAFLTDGSLCILDLPDFNTWEEFEGKEFKVEACICETGFGNFTHLTWLDPHVLLSVSHCGFIHTNTALGENRPSGFYLQEIEIACSENQVPGLVTSSGWHAKVSRSDYLEEPVIGIAPNPVKKCSAFVQFYGGKTSEYLSTLGFGTTGGGMGDNCINFSSSCPWFYAVNCGSLKPLLFGLDDLGRLHYGGKILCNNCSSFSFYSNLSDQVITHLILATKLDFLFIVDMNDIIHGEIESKYENFVHSVKKRGQEENLNSINIWERGAKVIGVLHGDGDAVIVQTTRGNLECIYPRKLVLASIINALTQRRFRDALLMVRRHRIDFNIIVDHCGWKEFLQSASEFVKQVKNLSYITEFVCGIKDENIMEKLYRNYISPPRHIGGGFVQGKDFKGFDANKKVSSVLMEIKKALEEEVPESPQRELCILTTLARNSPPALEEALQRIKVIRELELLGSNDPRRMSFPSAEEALKHLLWLSDSEAVFEAALGLYDLHLAAIVALNSQRDPKEFLPYLQELERMPIHVMRYNIDLKLHRFEKALKHIISAGDSYFSDCMNLLKENPLLFPLGHQLITDSAKRIKVLEAWGDHLVDKKCYEDAATTYLCCSSLEKALKAYRACGCWRGVLTVAGLLKLGKDALLQLAHELCEELQALGKPGEAAKIALEYCGDVNGGICLLISARDWEEALRIAYMHVQENLIADVKNASVEVANTLIGEYQEGLEKVGKYLTRYLAVRQRRLLLAAKLQAEDRSINDLDDDTVSEASSNFSGMSAYTTGTRKGSVASVSLTATSKAREMRRQRNRGKIRPGSAGEELALVEHMKGMSLTDGAKRELRSLLTSLLMLGEEEIARKLQRTGEIFQLSQMAAVKLAEDTMSTDAINEEQNLEHYMHRVKADSQHLEALSWQPKVLYSP